MNLQSGSTQRSLSNIRATSNWLGNTTTTSIRFINGTSMDKANGGGSNTASSAVKRATAGARRTIYGPKTALLVAFLILSGCTREEATASLRADLPVDEFEIIHARFPCRSPDMHFFGYRFRVRLTGESAYGNICWDLSGRKWAWQILPEHRLSRLNKQK